MSELPIPADVIVCPHCGAAGRGDFTPQDSGFVQARCRCGYQWQMEGVIQ